MARHHQQYYYQNLSIGGRELMRLGRLRFGRKSKNPNPNPALYYRCDFHPNQKKSSAVQMQKFFNKCNP